MNRFEQRARIDYLWNRLRIAVQTGFFVQKQMRQVKMKAVFDKFGLDSSCSYELSDSKVLEE